MQHAVWYISIYCVIRYELCDTLHTVWYCVIRYVLHNTLHTVWYATDCVIRYIHVLYDTLHTVSLCDMLQTVWYATYYEICIIRGILCDMLQTVWYGTYYTAYCVICYRPCDTLRTIWYAKYCGIRCSVWYPAYWTVIVILLLMFIWTFPCTLTSWPTLHLYWPLHTVPWKRIILSKGVRKALNVTHDILSHVLYMTVYYMYVYAAPIYIVCMQHTCVYMYNRLLEFFLH